MNSSVLPGSSLARPARKRKSKEPVADDEPNVKKRRKPTNAKGDGKAEAQKRVDQGWPKYFQDVSI